VGYNRFAYPLVPNGKLTVSGPLWDLTVSMRGGFGGCPSNVRPTHCDSGFLGGHPPDPPREISTVVEYCQIPEEAPVHKNPIWC
jgi:hypothetical protein